jgi:hypothetical protein
MFLSVNRYSSNRINHLVFVMVKFGVLFVVRTKFLNALKTIAGFKGLICLSNLFNLITVFFFFLLTVT